MSKIINKNYHCLSCEISRIKKFLPYCICNSVEQQNNVMKAFPQIEREVNHFNNIAGRLSSDTQDILMYEILQKTIEKSNKYENYQKAIDEISVILRTVIEMRPSQKAIIDNAATKAGEAFLEIVGKVQSDVHKQIDVEKYAGPDDIAIPGGPILGKPTLTVHRPKLGNINL